MIQELFDNVESYCVNVQWTNIAITHSLVKVCCNDVLTVLIITQKSK